MQYFMRLYYEIIGGMCAMNDGASGAKMDYRRTRPEKT